MDWYRLESRPGFSKATVSAWRASLEARALGSSSIIIRMSAIRKLAAKAADGIRVGKPAVLEAGASPPERAGYCDGKRGSGIVQS